VGMPRGPQPLAVLGTSHRRHRAVPEVVAGQVLGRRVDAGAGRLAEEHPLAGDEKVVALAAARVQRCMRAVGVYSCAGLTRVAGGVGGTLGATWVGNVVRAGGGGGARDPAVIGVAAGGGCRGRAP
jgi:hypothetical protein